jgi:hypothetical protein
MKNKKFQPRKSRISAKKNKPQGSFKKLFPIRAILRASRFTHLPFQIPYPISLSRNFVIFAVQNSFSFPTAHSITGPPAIH